MNWSTKNELKFLDGLGRWCEREGDRKRLLWNYFKTACDRVNWGHIEPDKVFWYLKLRGVK